MRQKCNLRKALKTAGLFQRELAKKAGCSVALVRQCCKIGRLPLNAVYAAKFRRHLRIAP